MATNLDVIASFLHGDYKTGRNLSTDGWELTFADTLTLARHEGDNRTIWLNVGHVSYLAASHRTLLKEKIISLGYRPTGQTRQSLDHPLRSSRYTYAEWRKPAT